MTGIAVLVKFARMPIRSACRVVGNSQISVHMAYPIATNIGFDLQSVAYDPGIVEQFSELRLSVSRDLAMIEDCSSCPFSSQADIRAGFYTVLGVKRRDPVTWRYV